MDIFRFVRFCNTCYHIPGAQVVLIDLCWSYCSQRGEGVPEKKIMFTWCLLMFCSYFKSKFNTVIWRRIIGWKLTPALVFSPNSRCWTQKFQSFISFWIFYIDSDITLWKFTSSVKSIESLVIICFKIQEKLLQFCA